MIDVAEATLLLGKDLIIGNSPEIDLAEKLYRQFDMLNYRLGRVTKSILVAGSLSPENTLIMKKGR